MMGETEGGKENNVKNPGADRMCKNHGAKDLRKRNQVGTLKYGVGLG